MSTYNNNGYPIPMAPPNIRDQPSGQNHNQSSFSDMDTVNRRQQLLRNPSSMVLHQNMHVLTKTEIDGLRKQGFTQGLAQAVASNRHHFALFIWIIDNSGSMSLSDVSKTVALSSLFSLGVRFV